MMTILRSAGRQTKTSARETTRESDGEEAGQGRGGQFVGASALSEASLPCLACHDSWRDSTYTFP